MPAVTFEPKNITIKVPENTSVFDAAMQAGLPVASSCSGNYVCGRCNVQIVGGIENLSDQTETERDLLQREGNSTSDRISCRTFIFGDCAVTTKYW